MFCVLFLEFSGRAGPGHFLLWATGLKTHHATCAAMPCATFSSTACIDVMITPPWPISLHLLQWLSGLSLTLAVEQLQDGLYQNGAIDMGHSNTDETMRSARYKTDGDSDTESHIPHLAPCLRQPPCCLFAAHLPAMHGLVINY